MRSPAVLAFGLIAGVFLAAASGVSAQTQPTPGPTKPPPVVAQPGQPPKVVAPGLDVGQCRAGWHHGLRWSKEQFDIRCSRLRVQK